MAHSPAFSRVRRLLAAGAWARHKGVDPSEAAFARAALDRREVLKVGAAAVTVAALPFELGFGTGDRRPPHEVTVAVIGAGMAGLHCALRLHQAGFDVTVWEARDRVGGRMWTGRGLFPDGLICELGGELIDSNHATMFALAKEFGIALDDRFAAEQPGMVRETDFLGGVRVSTDTLLAQTHALAATLQAHFDGAESSNAEFERLDQMSLAEWLDTYAPTDQYAELHAVIAAAWVGEYGLEVSEQSALNLIYLFSWDDPDEFLIYGESDERWHTHAGNDTFTTALADALGAERIRLGVALQAASGGRKGPYTLRLRQGETTFEEQADHLVLAVPFTRLREVDLTGLRLAKDKRAIIERLAYGTNAKVMGGFARRPWWDDHRETGLLVTDLPVQSGWDSTIGQEAASGAGVWTNFLGGAQGVASGQGTPEEWFAGVLPDLEKVWPGAAAAFSGPVVRFHWPSFEGSRGSYACYRAGDWQYWTVEGRREGRVHFCGEHCSLDFTGWMEGAAETGALVAAEILDDHDTARSPEHEAALGDKLLVPHASYHGDVQPKLTWPARRRLVRATLGLRSS